MAHRRRQDPVDAPAIAHDMASEPVARPTIGATIGLDVDVMVQVVDRLPALDRDRFACGAQVLARCRDASDDAARVELVGKEVADDRGLGAVATEALVVLGVAADDGDQWLPVRLRTSRQVGDGLGVGAHDPSGVLGALQVAGRPVDVVGNPREQHVNSFRARPAGRGRRRRPRRSTCPCCRRPATS